MKADLRLLCLNGAVVIAGAAFCALAALDFYITRGTDSPSLEANKAARRLASFSLYGGNQSQFGRTPLIGRIFA
ncbi:hypothetical protein [Duganella sp. Root1480D1]|uniref:hypothetical protein n=1 Tax=Duganella sp. Root1480D1 TaxID=1736471 RepID=UPI0007101B9E|nr:hypothetical protein [Duganella sp. Root1480D1]KQZ33493.1 hypothetical protein ASD58_29295 [Duganella sp. Root1480D1]